MPIALFLMAKWMSRAGKSLARGQGYDSYTLHGATCTTPRYPRPKRCYPALLPSSAFLGKEKSSPGGRQAGRRAR